MKCIFVTLLIFFHVSLSTYALSINLNSTSLFWTIHSPPDVQGELSHTHSVALRRPSGHTILRTSALFAHFLMHQIALFSSFLPSFFFLFLFLAFSSFWTCFFHFFPFLLFVSDLAIAVCSATDLQKFFFLLTLHSIVYLFSFHSTTNRVHFDLVTFSHFLSSTTFALSFVLFSIACIGLAYRFERFKQTNSPCTKSNQLQPIKTSNNQ